MARGQTISEPDLIGRLSHVFREQGFEGASLADLAKAAGLQKASLYHRFPGGKTQMAEEVLAAGLAWWEKNVLALLRGPGAPAERLAAAAGQLDSFYAGGRQACLLNMLSAPQAADSPFAARIKAAFEAITSGFAALAEEAGAAPAAARRRAERGVMLLHGSLVMARGMGSDTPFKSFLGMLPDELLGERP